MRRDARIYFGFTKNEADYYFGEDRTLDELKTSLDTWYDIYGYNRAGYNRNGLDSAGYDIAGYDIDGYDRDGLDKLNKLKP